MNENNQVNLSGIITTEPEYSNEFFKEKFYKMYIKVSRMSDTSDIIPVIISGLMLDVSKKYTGNYIEIEGEFRSYNQHDENKVKLILSVFAKKVHIINSSENQIYLNGFIVKEPKYRITPLDREIADILVAANRAYKKSDYIPCVVWGRNARYISQFPIGTEVKLEGRIQSREYTKYFDDGTAETRTAYEVSVSRIDVIEESEENTNESGSKESV